MPQQFLVDGVCGPIAPHLYSDKITITIALKECEHAKQNDHAKTITQIN